MLRKLIGYEFLATGRIFLPLYGAFVLISLIMRGAIQIQNIWRIEENSFMNLLMVIPVILYVGLFVATVVGTILIAISRFYKNLLSEEGYLTFTLPAKVWQLVVSKLIPAMVWSIASGLVCIVSVLILSYDPNTFNIMIEIWDQMVWGFSQGGVVINMGLMIQLLVVMLTSLLSLYTSIYAAIAATNFVNRHRVLMGIGAYIIIMIVNQMINTVLTSIQMVMYQMSYTEVTMASQLNGFVHGILWQSMAVSLFMSAVMFVVTNVILKKKLNLA